MGLIRARTLGSCTYWELVDFGEMFVAEVLVRALVLYDS